MTHLLIDTSVLIKWFHAAGEAEVDQARAVLRAHVAGDVEAHILDLAAYELGNVLIRALRWDPVSVADQLDDLRTIVGTPLVMTADWLRHAALLARRHQLTFYDACWAATAERLGMTLVSADQRLIDAALAESPTATVSRLRLDPAS
ncbi:MAG: type II toxin-antitoxin system VapC family toxin [Dermatophilaceae bacterium]